MLHSGGKECGSQGIAVLFYFPVGYLPALKDGEGMLRPLFQGIGKDVKDRYIRIGLQRMRHAGVVAL